MNKYLSKSSGFITLLLTIFAVGFSTANAATIYGVSTANQLVRFDSATPGTVTTIGTITGLQAAENVLAIDFRPATGQLYGLGSSSRLYTVNTVNGMASAVGTAGAFTLVGTDFGFDFNPTVDRIRVVSNTGQNIRLNPDTGALAANDTNLNPGTPSVSAAAYTNNFAGATTTVLYVIDSGTDTLNIQNPPNGGVIVPVGALGVDTIGVNGFDIATIGGMAFASLNVGGTSRLYTINLTTGAATQVAAIGGSLMLRGLSVANISAANLTTSLDFDGDRRADFANFNTSNANWTIGRSTNGSFYGFQYGLTSDQLTPGDFDGDGLADPTVWRPSTGVWYSLRSATNTVQIVGFGLGTDEPVARDYDGDGRTDFAVVRRTGGQLIWFVLNNAQTGYRQEQFGLDTDSVAVGDYDGDGRFDLAVKRGAGGQPATYFILQTTNGFLRTFQFGLGNDTNVPGDYDGDGRTDVAYIREGSNWTWNILRSSDGATATTALGAKGQFSVQADYNGDGRTDVSVWNPSTATYSISQSPTNTILTRQFGSNGDFPVANYNTF